MSSIRTGSLLLRAEPRGGALLDQVRPADGDISRHATAVLLVHGYDVPFRDACKAYQAMQRLLPEEVQPRSDRIFWLFWPGDDAGWLLKRKWSYPQQVATALAAAPKLASFLRDLHAESGQPRRIMFVGHSLGSRLVMETVAELARLIGDGPGPQVEALLLMAAAVPQQHCRPGQAYQSRLGRKDIALWSPRDWVLRVAFPLGQDRTPDGWSEAVGYRGSPSGRWHPVSRDTRLRHGDYWQRSLTADYVASLFGVPLEHRGRENILVEWSDEERTLDERQIAELHVDDACRWSLVASSAGASGG